MAEFVGDHFGQEAVDYLAEPLLSGIYGGDPALLSAESVLPKFVELERKYGSVARGVRKETVEGYRSSVPGSPRRLRTVGRAPVGSV